MSVYYEDEWSTLRHGDVRAELAALPAASVHTCVTSPPYWSLRDYGAEGQLGLEPTIAEYIATQVEVFEGVKRVLRPDGVCWLNVGDSYCNAGSSRNGEGLDGKMRGGATGADGSLGYKRRDIRYSLRGEGVKHKDLCLIPQRLAIALQDAGWWVRSIVIWDKVNPLPESVRDRPSTAHEYVLMLTKAESYYFDQEAVREPVTGGSHSRGKGTHPKSNDAPHLVKKTDQFALATKDIVSSRNIRSVWTIPTQPLSARKYGVRDVDHFAAYPQKLVEPCVLAGPRDVCSACGAPWERILQREERPDDGEYNGKDSETDPQFSARRMLKNLKAARKATGDHDSPFRAPVTLGWRPTCTCDRPERLEKIPATVLDPFFGSGTTGVVAIKHGRRVIGIDVKADYLRLAKARLGSVTLALPLEV